MGQNRTNSQAIRVGIIGATGYVGMELVRLLLQHPFFRLTALCSRSYAGQGFAEIYPAFRGQPLPVLSDINPSELAEQCDVVITALPHGVSATIVADLLERGLNVLDHSADFRFKDRAAYEAAYQLDHPHPELLSKAVYGLPEQFRKELKGAELIANPGCYPTCTFLGLAPLLAADRIRTDNIIVDAASGTTGAGRKAEAAYTVAEMGQNYKPYGVVGHRHAPEMVEKLSLLSRTPVGLTFTPHLLPIGRGMLATIYVKPSDSAGSAPLQSADLVDLYRTYYENEPFVRVLPVGQLPQIAAVVGSNFCDVTAVFDPALNIIKVFSAIDNLGKGACAQAVQALNLMYDLPETAGLMNTPFAI